MKYPDTPVHAVVDTLHGHKIIDKYRWLENSEDSAVAKWVEAQNKLTDRVISAAHRHKFGREIKSNYNFLSVQQPTKSGEIYFWEERQPGQQQSVLYIRKGLRGKKITLIDPNKLSKQKVLTLDYWFPSKNGKFLAYGLSQEGDELSKLKALDVATGKDIELVASNTSFASVAWLPDETGFYYTKHPEIGSVPKGDERFFHKAFLHKLGTPPSKDQEVFGKGRPKEDMLWLSLSLDGKRLIISASQEWLRNDLFLYDAETQKIQDLVVGLPSRFSATFGPEDIFLYSDHRSPNGRILKAPITDIPKTFAGWQEIIPERESALDWFYLTKDKILASYLVNATLQVFMFDHNGKESEQLAIPTHTSITGVSTTPEEEEFFYGYVSFASPPITCRYDSKTKSYKKFNESKSLIQPEDYVIKQEWYKSKDGTKVPMSIVHHKDVKLTGQNPTILYGYGGFGSPIIPYFLRSSVPWLSRGGIFALANIRGGGEFGKKWHSDAILQNKQKSYDDFIAAAEHLITNKYTRPAQLGILGGSNGGLLVSAVAIQRPDLFKAVESKVPLTDMVRFPSLLIASRWTSEYGDPSKAKDLAYILKYSPYHNVVDGVDYPAFLFTTASNDTRVDPMHARKMTALLQAANKHKPVLLFTDNATGHMGALTMEKFYQDSARDLAFFAAQLDLKI